MTFRVRFTEMAHEYLERLQDFLLRQSDNDWALAKHALFEIEDARTVTVLAVRHQREDDFH